MLGKPWLKSYPKNLDWNQHIEPKPIFSLLDEVVKNFPDNLVVDFEGHTIDYKTLAQLVEKAAKGFLELGLKKSSKVGLFLPNCPQFVVAYLAVLKAGGTVVNCSPLYSEKEIGFLVENSDAEMIITLDLEILYPKAKKVMEYCNTKGSGKFKKLIVANLPEVLPFPKNALFKIFKSGDVSSVKYDENVISWADVLKLGERSSKDISAIKVDVNDTAIIQYTGGTTGTPKGAELTHANVYVNTIQSKLWGAVMPDGEGIMLNVLPLFHVFAMTVGMLFSLASAGKMILHPRFEALKVLKDIQKKKPHYMPGVASMFNAINNYHGVEKYDLKSLHMCISGGGPLPLEVKKIFEKRTTCRLVEGYGLTEASPVVSCNPIDGVNKEGSIGLPFIETDILIEDIENPGKFLDIGERGELCIKGPQVMKGYYNKPDSTAKVLRDGILRTGDIAYMDDEGYIFIVDRLKEMIIAGGFKIYPRTVEEVLYQHPDVLEAAVIGVPDESRGQKVKAFAVLKPGAKVTHDELMEYCRNNLAKHEIPKVLEIKDSLPKSSIGKILKKDLS